MSKSDQEGWRENEICELYEKLPVVFELNFPTISVTCQDETGLPSVVQTWPNLPSWVKPGIYVDEESQSVRTFLWPDTEE